MERARSLSVQPRRNPVWSERIQGEWELQLRRPDALPPVPDDLNLEVELEDDENRMPLATDRSQTGRQQSPGRPRGRGAERFSIPSSWQGLPSRMGGTGGLRAQGSLPPEDEDERKGNG